MKIRNSGQDAGWCFMTWDGMLCWPPSPPGGKAILPCPSYIVGFDAKKQASRLCTLEGEWFVNPDTNSTWTNYSSCYSERMTKVLVRFPQPENSTLVEQYVPLVKTVSRWGYGVSFVTLVIALCILAAFKKLRCPRNKLHMHLFVSFMLRAFTTLMKDALFVRGVGLPSDLTVLGGETYFLHENEDSWRCKLLVSLWQYFIMCNYSWILMEGVYLHNLIFLAVFSDSSSISTYVVLGWGLPMVFVGPWVVIRAMWENTLCWTTNNNPHHFLLIKLPTTFSVVVNFVLFVNIIRLLLSKLLASISEEARRFKYGVYRRWAKSTLVLVPLFGVHYLAFLLLSFHKLDQNVELLWLFIDQIFTSFQGFLVAVLYCLLNGEVRGEMTRVLLPTWRSSAASFPLRMFSRQSQTRESYFTSATSRRYNGNTEKDHYVSTITSSSSNNLQPPAIDHLQS